MLTITLKVFVIKRYWRMLRICYIKQIKEYIVLLKIFQYKYKFYSIITFTKKKKKIIIEN